MSFLTDITVSDKLLEKLAEQVHITWMNQRVKDGWTYGQTRNDEKKLTPCIVPYKDLPEIEKEYDRITARTVINTLQNEGYIITRG